MRAFTLISAIVIASVVAQDISEDGPPTGALGNATVTVDNPPGEVYVATLPKTAFDKAAYPSGGNVKGYISAEAHPDGVGVNFNISFRKLPETGGPFTYHIHAAPVPADGNCTATGGHLDPFERTDEPVCDSKLRQTCQVGDLSGKYGKIPAGAGTFYTTYRDLYTSTQPGTPAFFGNLSFVMHYPNKTRITCANFRLQNPPYTSPSNSTSTVVPYSSSSSVPSSSVPSSSVPSAAPKSSSTVSGAAGAIPRAAVSAVGMAVVLEVAMILLFL